MRRLGRILVGAFFLLGILSSLSSCGGGESDSQKVDVTLLPDTPIVFEADRSIPDGQGGFTEIKGPWFSFRIKLKNGTSKIVTVVAMEVKLVDGSTTPAAFDGMDFDPPQAYLTQLAPAGGGGDEVTVPAMFYLEGLPKSDDGNYRLRAQIELAGWFGDEDNPESRFSRTVFFTTE